MKRLFPLIALLALSMAAWGQGYPNRAVRR